MPSLTRSRIHQGRVSRCRTLPITTLFTMLVMAEEQMATLRLRSHPMSASKLYAASPSDAPSNNSVELGLRARKSNKRLRSKTNPPLGVLVALLERLLQQTEAVQLFRLAHRVSLVYLSLTTLSVHVCPPPVKAAEHAVAQRRRCGVLLVRLLRAALEFRARWSQRLSARRHGPKLCSSLTDYTSISLTPLRDCFCRFRVSSVKSTCKHHVDLKKTPSMHWIACNLSWKYRPRYVCHMYALSANPRMTSAHRTSCVAGSLG